jgi:uncharacterized membrane protein YkoI
MSKSGLLCVALAAAMSVVGCKMQDKDEKEGSYKEISGTALPAAVRAGFDKAYPGATIKEVGQETYPDGTHHYEIEFVDKAGKEHEVELDSKGMVLPEEH